MKSPLQQSKQSPILTPQADKSSTFRLAIQKRLHYFSFKSKLRKAFKYIEFERSRNKVSNMNSDFDSLEIFEIFSSGIITNKSLQILNLSSTNLPDLNMIKLSQCLAKNKGLHTLDLSNNNISSLGFKYLFRMLKENHHVERLNLFNNEIQKESVEDMKDMIIRNKNLVELNLNFCGLDTLSIRTLLEGLSNAKHLKKIHLSKNYFDEKSFRGLGIFLSDIFLKLDILDFAYNTLDEKSLKVIKKKLRKFTLEHMLPSINELNFMGNRLMSPDAIKDLKYLLARISGIQTLNLSKTFLNYLNFQELSTSFKRIHHSLNLSNNIFKDQLPELTSMLHLKIVNLSKTGLCGKSIKNIANTLKNGGISWISLDLSNNRIENPDVYELFEALTVNKTLEILNLSDNRFTESSFQSYDEICSKWSLKELNLSNNPFTSGVFLENLFNNQSYSLRILYLDNVIFEKKLNILSSESAHIQPLPAATHRFEKLSLNNSLVLGPTIFKSLYYFTELIELNLENACILNKDRLNDLTAFLNTTEKLLKLSLRNLYLGRLVIKDVEILCKGFNLNKSLVELNLSKNKLNKMLNIFLKSISSIKTLKLLDLSNNYLSNMNSQIISDFLLENPHIESFNLSNNLISFVTIDKICDVLTQNNEKSSLKVLKLSNVSFSLDCLISIGYLLHGSTKIKELDLSNNEIVKINTATLAKKDNSKMDKLILTNCQYDEYQYRLLIKLLMRNPIKTLDLSGSVFFEANLKQFIKKTTNISTLINLDISYIALKDVEIGDLLNRFIYHKSIKNLRLNFLELKEFSSKALNKLLKRNDSLEVLDLSDNRLPNIFIKNLKEGLLHNKSLQILLLRRTRITDDSLMILKDFFEKNITLKHLDLRDNLFSIVSLEKFVEVLNINTHLKQGLEILLLSDNRLECKGLNEEFSLLNFSQQLKHNQTLSIINLANTFPIKPSEVNSLTESLKITVNLKRLDISNNKLGQNEAVFVSKLILSCQNLQFLSISNNHFGAQGIIKALEHLDKNLTLTEIDISNTITNEAEGVEMCQFLNNFFISSYNALEIINISNNFVGEKSNKIIYNTLKVNKKIYFLNNHWEKIRNDLACQVLDSLVRIYKKHEVKEEVANELKTLNFSDGKLDDDFCIYFAHRIHEYTYLESMNISENKRITLIGLKFIYVYLKFNVRLKSIYFKEYCHESALNNGIATSLIHWSKYTQYNSRFIKMVQKFTGFFFSKMQIIPNRFQYNDSFDRFFAHIKDIFIFLFFLINFIAQIFLALFLPIHFASEHCGGGQAWTSHIVYGIYLGFTLFFEMVFLIASRKKIESNIVEKDLKREVFINDMINLFGGVLLRFDTYTDICFLTIAYRCDTNKIFTASLIVVIVKLIVKFVSNFRALFKLIGLIRKNEKMDCLNLYAKLCCFQSMPLTNDILDRYCPGNAKRIHHILCKRLNHAIYLNIFILDSLLKFALEDIPQTILQSSFLFADKNGDRANPNNWIIWFSVLKNCCSLIGSFYSMVSLRPSYIEQSDFDEILSVQKVFKGKVGDEGFGLSLMKRMITMDKRNKTINKTGFFKTSSDKKNNSMILSMEKSKIMKSLPKEGTEESDLIVDMSEDVSFEKNEKFQYFINVDEKDENQKENYNNNNGEGFNEFNDI